MKRRLSSRKPYLLRALYDWIVDNQCTPHILADCAVEGVQVPPGYAQEGRIVLNVAPAAVQGLMLDNDAVRFSARFGGRPCSIFLPIEAVLAIYDREHGQGMMFPAGAEGEVERPHAADDDAGEVPPDEPDPPGGGGSRDRSHLKVIK